MKSATEVALFIMGAGLAGRVIRWERATPVALLGCVVKEKSATGVARSQRKNFRSSGAVPFLPCHPERSKDLIDASCRVHCTDRR